MGDTFLVDKHPGGIVSEVTVEDDEIIFTDTMPGDIVQKILDENAAVQTAGLSKTGPNGAGVIGARIPLPMYMAWQKEWREKYKLYMKWHVFLKRRLNSNEFSKLVFQKL